ncbi:hypothetical protein R1sor_018032 [Riccia sorocarpa]|uniref:Reverse transcriptase domain-containing protein n=1 Tax=Riccia sorocarpa TaxID=122646 RepID=A0ABD3IC94_9MARC
MPAASSQVCAFSISEVKTELRKLGTGKAADLMGLTVELLRWGVLFLVSFITQCINRACADGLPEEWTWRGVVPLHKAGPKRDPYNYRTIMVANLFSKLLGRLLDARLTTWCESSGARASAQAGFRQGFTTIDHALTLRTVMEGARRLKNLLYVLFVDFAKAFDSIPRIWLWERLLAIGVPQDLVNTIAVLYSRVIVKARPQGLGVSSTLGVIQGCPLPPCLFGLVIDELFWNNQVTCAVLGDIHVPMLLFADDVALIATSQAEMQQHLKGLEDFCSKTSMKVNLAKTLWLQVGSSPGISVEFQGQPVDKCKVYKYLVVLYGATTWGPSLPKTSWKKLESLQKSFLSEELGVRSQIPNSLLRAETARLPLGIEALIESITYARRLRNQASDRYSTQALKASRSHGWYADLTRWAARWGLSESFWDSVDIREELTHLVVRKLWHEPSPRQCYYLRDISPLLPYKEKPYLSINDRKVRHAFARFRISAHTLNVEEGRWKNIPREDRICSVCTLGKVEDEYHTLLVCPGFSDLRESFHISATNLKELFALQTLSLGLFILTVEKARQLALQNSNV